MKIQRRQFLAGASISTLLAVCPKAAKAILHRGSSSNPGNAIINGFSAADYPFANFFKSAQGFQGNPSDFDANGYPKAQPSLTALTTLILPPSYGTGNWVLAWKGMGAIKFNIPDTVNVVSGGFYVYGITPSNSGTVTGNFTAGFTDGTSTYANGRVVFNFPNGTPGNFQIFFDQNLPYGTGVNQLTDIYLCRASDETAVIANRNAFNPDFIADMKTLRPKTIRMMDWSSTNNCNLVDVSQRYPQTSLSLSDFRWCTDPTTGLWAGTTTNTGDAFACSNPPASGTGAYADGETVQCRFTAANTTITPTLNVGGRGAAPILDNVDMGQLIAQYSGTVLSGDTFSLTFTASYLPGGAITKTVTGNTSPQAVANALINAIDADSNLSTNNIVARSTLQPASVVLNYASVSGALTVTASKSSSGGTGAVGNLPLKYVGTSNSYLQNTSGSSPSNRTLVYSTTFKGWICYPDNDGLHSGVPIENQVALCNAVGAHLWYNISHLSSTASASALASYVSANLNSGLNGYFEYSNELWNFIFIQTSYGVARGINLGLPTGDNAAIYGWYALGSRLTQAAVMTGWGARSGLKRVMASQQYFGASAASNQNNRLAGAGLTSTGNSVYAALGLANYNSSPNRPIDYCDVLSVATYYSGAQCANFDANYSNASGTGLTTGGPSGWSTGLLGAADAYAAGGSTNIANAFAFLDWDFSQGTNNGTLGSQTLSYQNTNLNPQWSSIASGFSKPFECYEGAMEAYPPSTAECSNLGISTAYGGISGKIGNMLFAYKQSANFKALVLSQFSQIQAMTPPWTPCWYTFGGGQTANNSNWSVPISDLYGGFYTSWDAMVQFNN